MLSPDPNTITSNRPNRPVTRRSAVATWTVGISHAVVMTSR